MSAEGVTSLVIAPPLLASPSEAVIGRWHRLDACADLRRHCIQQFANRAYKRLVQDQQAGARAKKEGASVTQERAWMKALKEDKLRGRPRLLTSALRYVIGSRPTDNLGANDRSGKAASCVARISSLRNRRDQRADAGGWVRDVRHRPTRCRPLPIFVVTGPSALNRQMCSRCSAAFVGARSTYAP
jgi:hypothetical protein